MAEPVAAPYCKNCGAPLGGDYCADCGQKGDVHVPSTLELIHDALEGISHSDSRLWVSLKYLLFVPGKLTREFIAGRRATYLPPFRLYLVLSVIFFLTNSLTGGVIIGVKDSSDVTTAEAREFGALGRSAGICSKISITRLREGCERAKRDHGQNLGHLISASFPKAMFIFLPLIAFFHMLLYWRPRLRYAEHLLFFLHLQSYAFTVMTALVLLDAAGDRWTGVEPVTGVAEAALAISLPVYTLAALKRVFQRSWPGTFFRACALFLLYVATLALTMAGVFIYALWQS